tara:strand:+ start:653 stop:1048 length:396 start_codon:yes stop_codon:yes gene_type:complete
MQVEIYTLIDITDTGVKHADSDTKKFQQQANLNTVIQTVSLTTNVYLKKTYSTTLNINALHFGSKYRNKQKCWIAKFEPEVTGSFDLDILKNNFNLVPIILGLDETVKVDQPVFYTTDEQHCNIIFNFVDY